MSTTPNPAGDRTDQFPDKERRQEYTDAFNLGNLHARERKGQEYQPPLGYVDSNKGDGYWAGWTSGGGRHPKTQMRQRP